MKPYVFVHSLARSQAEYEESDKNYEGNAYKDVQKPYYTMHDFQKGNITCFFHALRFAIKIFRVSTRMCCSLPSPFHAATTYTGRFSRNLANIPAGHEVTRPNWALLWGQWRRVRAEISRKVLKKAAPFITNHT